MDRKQRYIRGTEHIVRDILTTNERARRDDAHLYGEVVERFERLKGQSITCISAIELLNIMSDGAVPPFETVSRIRRKLQAEHPELRPSKEVQSFRAELEDAFMEYALRKD